MRCSSLFFVPALLLAIGITSNSSADEIYFFEDFEDAAINYSTSVADNLTDIANSNYFGRIAPDTSSLPSEVIYSNLQGNGFYGVQDTDATSSGDIDNIDLEIFGIDISNKTNLKLSFFVAEDEDDDGTNEDWDSDTSFFVEYQIDGGGFQKLFAIEAEEPGGNQTNNPPRVDTDFDGIGDGALIVSTFTEYISSISGTGSTLDIRFNFDFLDASDEDLGLDSIKLTGIPEPTSAMLLLGLAPLAFLTRRRSQTAL